MSDLYDFMRRYEFNKTEPETLGRLIDSAVEKSSETRRNLSRLRDAATHIADVLVDEGLVVRIVPHVDRAKSTVLAGVDGSCQQVGGFGGLWYVPISVAIVAMREGIDGPVDVTVEADIEALREEDGPIGAQANERMLRLETKALNVWAGQSTGSILLIDGPIVDPPRIAEPPHIREAEYVRFRCGALLHCVSRSIDPVGCAKTVTDRALTNHLERILGGTDERLAGSLHLFTTDAHLVTLVFAILQQRPEWESAALATVPISVSHPLYLENGVGTQAAYLQRDLAHQPVRIEVAVAAPNGQVDEEASSAKLHHVLGLASACIYPGHQVPLPVHLAHEKCNIRQGCAETLYQEIMTGARASDPLSQIVLTKLSR